MPTILAAASRRARFFHTGHRSSEENTDPVWSKNLIHLRSNWEADTPEGPDQVETQTQDVRKLPDETEQ
jgi:hypothetical protein